MIQFIRKDKARPIKGILDKRAAVRPQLMYRIVVKIPEAAFWTGLVVVVFCCVFCIWYDFSATFPKNRPLMASKAKNMGKPKRCFIYALLNQLFVFMSWLPEMNSQIGFEDGVLPVITDHLKIKHRSRQIQIILPFVSSLNFPTKKIKI